MRPPARTDLYLYSCLLPHALWALPNKWINCEDILMNLVVGTAAALPPVFYMPLYGPPVDYGTPAPEEVT